MKTQSIRQSAVDAISKTSDYVGTVDYTTTSIKEVYAEHVFTASVQRERLPKGVFKKLQHTLKTGEQLDAMIADAVAVAMRDWAIEHGATHYTHWFQPMTGATAEKHDSFITPTSDGGILAQFSAKELIMGEPDASSFPSGGLRATFEARGYTAWDPSSPAFILENPNGSTLVIPTVFFSWEGDALDKKTPLLRSIDALSTHAMRILKLFGNKTAGRVLTTVGPEQEYFLIDKHFYHARPDLINTRRTLLGPKPPKAQKLYYHYFGSVPERVIAIMQEVEYELLRLGVPIKTRHNEVAPGQYEIAPTFETANLAIDHQLMTMDVLKRVANRHGMVCLLHEKPFAGINGSGKHNNWSMITDDGENLLGPGDTPHANAQFLVFCAATCRAVHKYGHLLRLSAGSAANDHRLGANEAPPAIISVFLGDQLQDIFEQIMKGGASKSKSGGDIQLGVSMIPGLPRDAGDRNRTSPFAFTGNRFEFRAVGSSQNPSGPNTVINAVVADSLDYIATEIEKITKGKTGVKIVAEAVQKVLAKVIKECSPVLFLGDNYSADWHKEAEKRGLRNLPTTIDAIKTLDEKASRAVLGKYGIYSERELDSRKEILLENYSAACTIEAETAVVMANTMILPAALRFQAEVANAIVASKEAGVTDKAQEKMLKDLVAVVADFKKKTVALEKIITKVPEHPAMKAGEYACNKVLPAMLALREVGDLLETIVSDDLWPLPTYREMLFIR